MHLFQLLKYIYRLLVFVFHVSKLFWFWTVSQTKQGMGICQLTFWKIVVAIFHYLINQENNL